MIYLGLNSLLDLHARMLKHSGGQQGIRDQRLIDLALEEPRKTLAGQQVSASLLEKATALGYSILLNRPFYDGNKRMAHYALATFLKLNGTDIFARVDEQEKVVRALAAGMMDPKHFLAWLRQNSTSATAK
jgi:death-on-curing protein